MIAMAKTHRLMDSADLHLIYEYSNNKVLVFKRADLLFVFNFHPQQSYPGYRFEAPSGTYRMLLNSDAAQYGGHSRLIADQEHLALAGKNELDKRHYLNLYLPSRTAIVLQHLD
jgi:1,4-alpha-glucan branching enzyme